MNEPDYIAHETKDKAILQERAIWELCRKHAQNLWDELIRENLLAFGTAPEAPVTLIAVMQRNVLWDAPGAWHIEDSPLPSKRSVKIGILELIAKIRKRLERKARKSSI